MIVAPPASAIEVHASDVTNTERLPIEGAGGIDGDAASSFIARPGVPTQRTYFFFSTSARNLSASAFAALSAFASYLSGSLNFFPASVASGLVNACTAPG